jgi:hypothetical protein
VGDKTSGFVTPFKVAADALKPGESTPGAVESQFGYHYIERDDPAKAAEIEAALKKSLARELTMKSKATDVAQAIAARVDAAMRTSGKSAEDAIKDATAPYVKAQKVDMLKVIPAPPEATDGGTDAAALVDASTGPQKVVAPVLPSKTFDASTDGDRPTVQTSSAFNRGGETVSGLSPEGAAKVMAFAFSAKEGEVLDTPGRTAEGWAVVALKQRKSATREEFEKDRTTFEDELLRMKRDEALSLYVKRLRDQAKDDVKVDEAYVQEAKVDGGSSSPDEEDEP